MPIITYNGTEAESKNCRKIAGQYYKIGDPNIKNSGQCYEIEDTYYRETSNKIAWNSTKKCYDLITNGLVKGWVEEGGVGYFSYDVLTSFIATDNLYVQNEEAIIKNKLFYDFACGKYSVDGNSKNGPIRIPSKPTYSNLRTDIYSLAEYDTSAIKMYFNKYTYVSSVFDKFLNNQNFGLEVETDLGWLPECKYLKLGCVPLKDGSIQGTEITTLKYPANFRLMEELFETCTKYTASTSNNSLHVNISGFQNNSLFRVALYNLYYRIQQEILQFIPMYKRTLEYFTSKAGGPKDHCKPMESLQIVKRYLTDNLNKQVEEADTTIFRFLNEGQLTNDSNPKTRRHFREGGHKWDQRNRYYALNLMPLYFGPIDSSRIEFRIHSGTVNKYKALTWIFICSAIVEFVNKNATRILTSKEKITLDDILCEQFNNGTEEGVFLYEYITKYIAQRTQTNTNMVIRHDDNVFGDEFENDRNYTFAINGKSIFNFESQINQPQITTSGKPPKKRS